MHTKMDTINRLLKKQVPKRRGRAAAATLDAVAESGAEEEQEFEKPPAVYARYVQSINGSSLAIPDEWVSSPAGELFSRVVAKSKKAEGESITWSGKMVEEVA
jgi:Ino eighty subunit 2